MQIVFFWNGPISSRRALRPSEFSRRNSCSLSHRQLVSPCIALIKEGHAQIRRYDPQPIAQRVLSLQMALLNALYGDPAGGFGVRTVTVSSSAVTLQPSPLPKPKKSGKRTSARCTACGEVRRFLRQRA